MTDMSLQQPAPRWAFSLPHLSYGKWGLRLSAAIYLAVFIIVPISVVVIKSFSEGWEGFWQSLANPTVISAIWLTVWTSIVMALVNVVMGTLTAYALVAYDFPLKGVFNALIDLPFAIPTLVTGVMLVILYGPQSLLGDFFKNEMGIRIIFAPPAIIIALLFIGYPFVIRTVQPVLESLEPNQQEAAETMGASGWRIFWRVIFPAIRPAMVAGGMLSFARALGEFGSIIIVSGNIPMRSQTATVYLYGQVEGGNMMAASAVSAVLLLVAFGITIAVEFVEARRHASR
jgi:sulfate transport system permease protein